MKKTFPVIAAIAFVFLFACNSNKPKTEAGTDQPAAAETDVSKIDPNRGIGKFTKVEVSPTLDQAMADKGKAISETKCLSCHKLTDEKLVGPGWKGVTARRTPEWIMNFSTNPEEMLNKDPEAQAMLEICLIRMPNQNVTEEDARSLFEFMRANDGVK